MFIPRCLTFSDYCGWCCIYNLLLCMFIWCAERLWICILHIDLHKLFVYSDMLMYLLIESIFLVEFSESLMYSVIPFANRNRLTISPSEPFSCLFLAWFFQLCFLVKYSKGMGIVHISLFFSNFNVITSRYSQFRRMLAVGCSYIAFIVLIFVEACFL